MGKVQGQEEKEEAQGKIEMELTKLLKVLIRDFKLPGSQIFLLTTTLKIYITGEG